MKFWAFCVCEVRRLICNKSSKALQALNLIQGALLRFGTGGNKRTSDKSQTIINTIHL